MKQLRILPIITFSIFAFCVQAQYQSNSMWGYTYDISLPMGALGDFHEEASFRGLTIQGRGFVAPQISIGGSLGWHVFNDVTEETTEFEYTAFNLDDDREISVQGALSGTQYRYTNAFPILVNAHYYLQDPGVATFTAFAGLGLGTTAAIRRVEIGLVAIEETTWHFALAPEVGFVWGLNPDVKALGIVRYLNNFETNKGDAASYLSFQIGLATGF
jgi:hypothetical protein